MGTKASNFQVRTDFAVGFKNWHSWHYCYFLLHLIRVTYVIASLKARNFEKVGSCCFKFQNMKNLCPYFFLLRNSLLYLLRFSKTHRKKKKNRILNSFLKGRYILLGYRRNMNFGLFWEAKLQFLKNVVWVILSNQC